MRDDNQDFEKAGGEVENALTAAMLAAMKSDVERLAQDSRLVTDRDEADSTRFCLWPGQSPDSRKHKAASNGEDQMPFEGACDQRLRMADSIVNERVMLCMLAALRGKIRVVGTDGTDEAFGARMELLHRHVIEKELGLEYVTELSRLCNYVFGDNPGIGYLRVLWRERMALERRQVTVEQLRELYLTTALEGLQEAGAEDAEMEAQVLAAADAFEVAMANPELGDEVLAEMVRQFFPHINAGRALKAVRQLRKTGKAEFPVPYVAESKPEICARQLNVDFFMSRAVRDFQRAPIYYEREWLTRAEVLEREATEGWNSKFVAELVGDPTKAGERGHEGESIFRHYERADQGAMRLMTEEDFRGFYEVLHATFIASDADGIPGRYMVSFSHYCTEAATERVLLDYAHGKYPGHLFAREVTGPRMTDSRGLPYLASSYQDMMKLFSDSWGDHAQIAGVPPIITRGRRNEGKLYLGPLSELRAKRDGDYAWLQPPQYPATIRDMMNETRRQFDDYFGRRNKDVPPELVRLHEDWTVFWFLLNLREVHKQILQLAQQYMSEEKLERIVSDSGDVAIRSKAEIQGLFDVSISFDPRDLDPEFLASLGETIKNVLLPLDTEQTVDKVPIVANLMYRLSPEMAAAALRGRDRAAKSELDDEWSNYLMISAGREPPMVTDGTQNYALRLGMYESLEQANPSIWQALAPDRMQILQARLEHLKAMTTQFGANAQIGRQGTKAGLDEMREEGGEEAQ